MNTTTKGTLHMDVVHGQFPRTWRGRVRCNEASIVPGLTRCIWSRVLPTNRVTKTDALADAQQWIREYEQSGWNV